MNTGLEWRSIRRERSFNEAASLGEPSSRGVEERASRRWGGRVRAWQCLNSNRGPFHVIEVWVENETMVEILPPKYAQEYLAFTRPDKVKAAMVAAPVSSARQHRS